MEQVEGCYGCRMLARRAADAQATIAALQADKGKLYEERNRMKDMLDRIAAIPEVDEGYHAPNEECIADGVEALVDEYHDCKQQLTQRTAERDTARRRVDELEAREVDVVMLREDLEQRTAELEAAKREVDVWKEKAELRGKEACAQRAELERVSLLSSHNERRFEEVDKKYKELRTLIAALPKVEYEIKASNFIAHIWPDHDTEEPLVDLRASVAALLKHRQGMEG